MEEVQGPGGVPLGLLDARDLFQGGDPLLDRRMGVVELLELLGIRLVRAHRRQYRPGSQVIGVEDREHAQDAQNGRASWRSAAPEGCSYFSWMIPTQFLQGSMNQAISPNGTSATPSTVFRPGRSYSSIFTPRERSSASSAARSFTRQAAWVCESAVPTVLLLMAKREPPPHLNWMAYALSSRISRPILLR